MPLNYRRASLSYQIELYTEDDLAWEGSLKIRRSGTTMYAQISSNLSHANASHLRVRKGGVTYAVLAEKESIDTVPEGLILFYNSTAAAPTGWTVLTTSVNKYLIGAGGALTAGQMGGATSVSATTTYNGNHSTQTVFMASYEGRNAGGTYGNYSSAGNHAHNFQIYWSPHRKSIRLIQATTSHTNIPSNIVVLSNVSISNMDEISDSTPRYLYQTLSSITTTNSYSSASVSSAGQHVHATNNAASYQELVSSSDYQSAEGVHTHTNTTTVTNNLYVTMLRAWTKASTTYDITSKMIGMWATTTGIPDGWVICNGSNGTPDLRDRFIGISTSVSTYGNGNVSFSVSLSTVTWTHKHRSGNVYYNIPASPMIHDVYSPTHSHSYSTTIVGRDTLSWKAMVFIMKL